MKTLGIFLVLIMGLIATTLWSQNIKNKKLLKIKTFEERLDDQLILAQTDYNEASKNFGINFISRRMVIFQMIKRTLLEGVQDEAFGFGIHLSFDDSFSETTDDLQNFKNLKIANDFTYHSWDGIDTYQLDLKDDKEKVIELT